jgi:hypothetical protein
MTRSGDIAALQGLARLILDHRLSQLRQAADRREQSRMQIAALDVPQGSPDLGLAAAQQVAMRYQLWADVRRSELNTVLARQTAEWMASREEARHAFGKTEALRGIAARLPRRT